MAGGLLEMGGAEIWYGFLPTECGTERGGGPLKHIDIFKLIFLAAGGSAGQRYGPGVVVMVQLSSPFNPYLGFLIARCSRLALRNFTDELG